MRAVVVHARHVAGAPVGCREGKVMEMLTESQEQLDPCLTCGDKMFMCLCPKKIKWDKENLPPLKEGEVRYCI
jgi:Zn ribbon nucleic-acid-binding protein